MKVAKKVFCLIFAFIFCMTSIGFAQTELKIKEVKIEGNKSVSSDTILAKIKTQRGQMFSRSVLNDDLKRLYALGYFTDVSIDVEDEPDGIIVRIIVEEKPIISKIVIEGNQKLSDNKIKKSIITKDGDLLNYTKLSTDLYSIRELYKSKGFERVVVNHKIDKDPDSEGSIVVISIEENARETVVAVSIEGNESVKTDELFKFISTKPKKWFWQKGYFNQEKLEQDVKRLSLY
jgi:outer membrane protein insertion porin family